MMNFRSGKKAIIQILNNNAVGRYTTIGAQKQTKDAKAIKNENRYVQVYYSVGNFPLGVGRQSGPTQHHITYRIELSISEAAKVDLAILNSDTATASEKIAALAAISLASDRVDDSMDELIEIVYQILMNGENLDLAFPSKNFSQKWIDQIQKGDPTPKGELVVLTATMLLTAKAAEQVGGLVGTDGTTNDTTMELVGDDNAKQGVTQVN